MVSGYGLKEHVAFLRDKLAKLYPLHVLAVVLSIVVAILSWGGAVSPKVLLAHLTLTSSWIPNPAYYFGANPVAWFVCDLFFLYLMAPIVVANAGSSCAPCISSRPSACWILPLVWSSAILAAH